MKEKIEILLKVPHLINQAAKLQKEVEPNYQVSRNHEDDKGNVRVAHYTSLSTTCKLLKDPERQYLRLYDSVHLTDPQEGSYIFGDKDVFPPEYIYDRWIASAVSPAYSLSFFPVLESGNGNCQPACDHLAHWRAYGDNGSGCSLEISVPRSYLWTVKYGSEERKKAGLRLQAYFDAVQPLFDKLQRFSKSDDEYDKLRDIACWLLKIRFLHKHSAYEYEKEWRAITVPSSDMTIRNDPIARSIRHFIEEEPFRMSKLFESECRVTIGPAVSHQADVVRSLQRLVTDKKVEFVISEIPYRP